MKTRPILFSGPMIRALLDGRKSQTRRVVKTKENMIQVANGKVYGMKAGAYPCPYGDVGDRLWCRETFAIAEPGVMARNDPGGPIYAADYPPLTGTGFGPWKPSIFMPRAVSRITLEITDVRVERVQSIRDEDFVPEGFPYSPDRYEDGFAHYWEKLNAKRGYGWDTNPWVFVLEFKVVNP